MGVAGPVGTFTEHTSGRGLTAQIAAPLRRYLNTEAGSAGLLLAATATALIWANLSDTYEAFWDTGVAVRVGGAELTLDLKQWVNDGLMTFFFFVIGLEVKRELVMGELTERRRAAVPLAAAAAGLAVPALIYLALNPTGPATQAWGAVISTDTAFLLGVLALVGPACPAQLRVFLLTLAIADDIGALTVIAVFYTERLALAPLAAAIAGLGLMLALRYLQVWRGPAYLVIAVGIWLAMHASGVHPTLAGVLIAFLIPAYPARPEEVEEAARRTRAYRQSPNPQYARAAQLSIERSVSPNERLESFYHPWTSFVIVPIFALANAGVVLDATAVRAALQSPVTLGVVVGLVLGKPIGITLGIVGSVRLRLGVLPPGLRPLSLAGGAALSGIGFTISLFIVDLALDDDALADQARIGILAAAVLATAFGYALFRLADRFRRHDPVRPRLLNPPVDAARDHTRGPVDAPLTLVEFGDFECPFCGRATGVVLDLQRRFGDRLRYVFRHIPLAEVHPHAELAAEAAEAAGAQGRFWEMHDRLFAQQDRLTATDLLEHAAALGLDLQRFTRDLGDGRYAERVREDAESAEASGVRETPTFFVGGRRHVGPYDAGTLAAELVAAAGDAVPPGAPATPATAPPAGDRAVEPAGSQASRRSRVPLAHLPADVEDSPDTEGAYPRLTDAQLALAERHGTHLDLEAGEVLFSANDRVYDFFVVLSGAVAVVEDLGRPTQRVVAVHGPRQFAGELNLLRGGRAYLPAVVVRPAHVLRLSPDELRRLLGEDPQLRDVVDRAFLLRRSVLLDLATEVRIIGRGADPDTRRLSDHVQRRGVPYVLIDLDHERNAGETLARFGVTEDQLPIVRSDARVLNNPSENELDDALGH